MEDISLIQCSLCNEDYDDGEHCPRILPCTHTFCSDCVGRLISQKSMPLSQNSMLLSKNSIISCPVCRHTIRIRQKEDIMFNRDLLELAKLFSKMKAVTEKPKESKNNFSYQVWKEELKNNVIGESLPSCLQEKTNVEEAMKRKLVLITRLEAVIKNINCTLFQGLRMIEDQCEKHIKNLKADYRHLDVRLLTLSMEEKKIREVDVKLETSQNFASADSFVTLAEEINGDLSLLKHDLEQFLSRDKDKHSAMLKNVEATENHLTVIADILTEQTGRGPEDLENQEEEMATSAVRSLNTLNTIPQLIKIRDLEKMNESLVETIQEGDLWAYKSFGGSLWYSAVEFGTQNSLFIHHLSQRGYPPSDAVFVMFDDIVQHINISSKKTFLKLGLTDGTYLGKVILSLMDEGHYAENFFHLCLGDKQCSYNDSKLLGVWNKGEKNECLLAGDYETNIGGGGRAVIPEVNWEAERNSQIYKTGKTKTNAGSLVACEDVRENISQFLIYTRDNHNSYGKPAFGRVEEGMDVIRKVIAQYHEDLSVVKIISCGVVLPVSQNSS